MSSGAAENKPFPITTPTSALSKLSIDPRLPKKPISKHETTKTPNILSESWEDEVITSEDDQPECPVSPQHSTLCPQAPPPTPISPALQGFDSSIDYNITGISNPRIEQCSTLRPDKTDAVAKRLIAGALGIRPPPKTEEQKLYEAAMKEKEIKRRNKEKQALKNAEEDAERSKRAIWSD